MAMNKIQEIIEQIKELEKKLFKEIEKKEEEFYYQVKGKKIYFEKATRKYHKTLVTNIYKYFLNANVLNILTVPLVWFCIFPAVFLDISVSFFQAVCFPIYKIPKVRRNDYLVVDRHALSYLNWIEKINCVYCGYFNGLISYVLEIAARTEQYWCPIKHARKVGSIHSRYKYFLEYGDGENHKDKIDKIRQMYQDID